MSLLDNFRASNAWDERYRLPTCPNQNNPWLYMAYAERIGFCTNQVVVSRIEAEAFGVKCEIESGLIARWPTKDGGMTSHDELIGACSLSPWLADRIAAYLERHDGEYNSTGEVSDIPERYDLFRIVWLMPYVRACAGWQVGLFSQLLWSVSCILSALDADLGGGKLRFWLMFPQMENLPLCSLAIAFFRACAGARGITPQSAFRIEPRENPVFADNAPLTW